MSNEDDEETRFLLKSRSGSSSSKVPHWENSSCCCGLMEWRWIDTFEYRSDDEKNSFYSTVALLMNAMIGSGLLAQPYAFKSAGAIGVSIEYVVFGAMTYWGVELLHNAGEQSNTYDYGDLVVLSIGPYGRPVYDAVIVFGGLGSMLSYVFVIQSLSTNIVSNFYTFDSVTEVNELKVMVTVISFITITPLCLIRNFGHLSRASFVSMFVVGGTVVFIFLHGLFEAAVSGSSSSSTSSIEVISLTGMLHSLGNVVFSFSFSAALFPALRSANAQALSHESARGTLQATTLLGGLLCFLIGLSGYLTFRSDTQSDILLSFGGRTGIILQAVFVGHLCLVLPADLLVSFYNSLKKHHLIIRR